MKIVPKTIWANYLIFGISLFLLIIFSSCEEEEEFSLTMDLKFINETENSMSFRLLSNSGGFFDYKLNANSESATFSYLLGGANKNIEPETCCQEYLIDIYGVRGQEGVSQRLILNDSLCITHLNAKSVIISNYFQEVLGDRHFKFTYNFTSEDFVGTALCE